MRINPAIGLFGNLAKIFTELTNTNVRVESNKIESDERHTETEIALTELDLQNIESEIAITDLDLRVLELEGGI